MKKDKTINVGGVHEHYNFPWQHAINHELFKQHNIHVSWLDCPGGTGEMVEKLCNGELDMAVALTEGTIKSISEKKPISIAQWYVTSPLIWSLHVKHDARIKHINELEEKIFAISRYGSGSHLMSYVLAKQQQWSLTNDNFFVVNSLKGAITAFSDDKVDGFLWEKYTTQPLIDQQLLRRIGECPTPWPAFVIAINNHSLQNNYHAIKTILHIIQSVCEEIKNKPHIISKIANFYQLDEKLVKQWIKETAWSTNNSVNENQLNQVIHYLAELNLVKTTIKAEALVNSLCLLERS